MRRVCLATRKTTITKGFPRVSFWKAAEMSPDALFIFVVVNQLEGKCCAVFKLHATSLAVVGLIAEAAHIYSISIANDELFVAKCVVSRSKYLLQIVTYTLEGQVRRSVPVKQPVARASTFTRQLGSMDTTFESLRAAVYCMCVGKTHIYALRYERFANRITLVRTHLHTGEWQTMSLPLPRADALGVSGVHRMCKVKDLLFIIAGEGFFRNGSTYLGVTAVWPGGDHL